MIDLPSAGMAAVRDPLVVTLFTFSLLGLLTHFLFPAIRSAARSCVCSFLSS
jgi:hypothetical protein